MSFRKILLLLGVLGLSLPLLSCSNDGEALPAGDWRGVITLPGGELPFQLELIDPTAPGVKAYVINGAERVPVTHMSVDGSTVVIDFPAFNNRFTLEAKNGELAGELMLTKRHGKLQHMPVVFTSGENHRFFAETPAINADFAGRWRVQFTDEDGELTPAVADFEQENGRVTGTFRTPTGDYRYLAGEVRDRTLYLSTFDGAHAFLFDATMSANGQVKGNFWSGTQWHERWEAIRDADAELPDPNAMSKVITPGPVVVEFPNTDGELVSSEDAAFEDKVLIIALAGSWCPNCHDEAAFLAPFYRTYRERGLEIIGLMYEHLDEFDEAAEQVNKFREKFGIDYPLLVAGGSDKKSASETLPMLNKVIAYPTMIVMDRKGDVRRVHTGFNGPGTGEKYEEFRRDFTRFVEQLLDEEQS